MKIRHADFVDVILSDGETPDSDLDYQMVFLTPDAFEDYGDLGPATEEEDWGTL